MSIRQGRPEDYSKGPVSHCLRCCFLPLHSTLPLFPFASHRLFNLLLLAKAKSDKWMLTQLLIAFFYALIDRLRIIFDILHKRSMLSYLVFSPFFLVRAICENFVMHFIYSQRQILIYGGDTANIRRISRPAKLPYESTLAGHFILCRREKEEGERGREREEKRTVVLPGAPKL